MKDCFSPTQSNADLTANISGTSARLPLSILQAEQGSGAYSEEQVAA